MSKRCRWWVLGLLAMPAVACGTGDGPWDGERIGVSRAALVGVPQDGYPSYQERLMLVAINRARSDPNVVGKTASSCYNTRSIRPPLMHNHDGARCARFHCANCILNDGGLSHSSYCTVASNIGSTFENGCDGSASCACSGGEHFSCTLLGGSGTSPGQRCGYFGYGYAGEVGAAGYADGWAAVYGWMSECPPATGHRDILTGTASEIGLGYYTGSTACWSRLYFGDLGNGAVTIYPLPAGVHYPSSSSSPDFYVNYYDTDGAPSGINVVVDGTCTPLSLEIGSAQNGTYQASVNVGSGCHQYWFLAWDGSGARRTYPEVGAWGVGSCTGYVATATPADCDGCSAGDTQPCGVGQCAGNQTCLGGGSWSACDGAAPDADESCDGVDNDCDGDLPSNESDPDGDGYLGCDDDCDDSDGSVHPGATEQCNGLDDDCSGSPAANECDADSDGYMACEGDCNDGNGAVHPGATEQCNGLDDDCSGSPAANEIDGDGDGYMVCENDCDDGDGAVHPGALEQCNGLDDDCSGSPAANESDADGDGYLVCESDCDDGDSAVHPGATEQCNGTDDDCDAGVDEGCPCDEGTTQPCGTDVGACEQGQQQCSGGVWGDCEGGVLPTQEICNGADDDCDGDLPAVESDADGDGYVACDDDCDDADGDVHPGQTDICNGVDDDCDGTADEDCGCDDGATQACGTDVGPCQPGTQICESGIWAECTAGVQPVDEACGDGVDNDCDGTVDEECDAASALDESRIVGECSCRAVGAARRVPLGWAWLALLLLRRRRRGRVALRS